MSEAPLESLTAAVPLVLAASSAPGLAEPKVTPVINARLAAPFPRLDGELDTNQQALPAGMGSGDMTAATAAALTNILDSAQAGGPGGQTAALPSPTGPSSLSLAMAGVSVQSPTTASGEGATLASLQRNAHDQVLEIMSTYHTNSHRRRSSVEAAAAASSVLASIASSTKSYMDGGAAAAIVAAATNPQPPIPQIGSYSSRSSQHNAAAAALLAASGMHSAVLPTISSVSASLQGTPAPGERMNMPGGADDDAIAAAAAAMADDAAMASIDAGALGGLPTEAFANAGQTTASVAPSAAGLEAALRVSGPSHSAQSMNSPTKTPGRRRKAAAGVSAAAVAAAKGRRPYDSMSDDQDDDDDDDDDIARDESGMPLTPDAPGSGRPGSLRHLTPDERRARRLQRNRLAAKECRQKKKAYINNLESQVCDLQEENSQLRKEIEELNARLTLSDMRASSSVTTPILEPRIHAPPERGAEISYSRHASPTLTSSKRARVDGRSPISDAAMKSVD
ncbi:hypothetical protein IWW37_002849 [Coemansia sp. RSA 2050]|nr:hypothetical protein IWW37_002849 [Coemansia sp. RSA 2050]KAJ2733857.1 hypothetical protein IW152_002722 [Coemansia sp. BCRC 34962]